MLMSKKNRIAIYEQLFNEGVLVAMKDTHAPKHPELPDVPNLQVRNSLRARLTAQKPVISIRKLTRFAL